MKKRDFTSAFENDNSISTGLSLDDAVHGLAPKLDTGRIVARPISIFEIYPDPMQPRRAIPSSVRQGWNGDPAGVERVLVAWHSTVEAESGRRFDLDAYLDTRAESDDEDESAQYSEHVGPMESAFRTLVDLAVTIHRDGLTNPITVAEISNPVATRYRLETGERRWLAYHLLHANSPQDERWTKIPARVVDAPNLWRQAAENNARDNLNAIAKARQYALLLMDLWSNDPGAPIRFEPFDAFENEREFYAQAVGEKANRAPSGRNHLIMSAMGISSRGSLSFYKRFLTLPDEIWKLGDDYNLSEEVLYRLAKMEPQYAIAEAHKIVLGQNNSQGGKRKTQTLEIDYRPGTKRYFAQVMQVLSDAGKGNTKADETALGRIQELRAWLDSEEERIAKSR